MSASWLDYATANKSVELVEDENAYAVARISDEKLHEGEIILEAHFMPTDNNVGAVEDFLRMLGCEPIRVCRVCGNTLTDGYTDEGEFYCCPDHFHEAMQGYFGESYREVEDDGCGGYFEFWDEYRESWAPTGVYYTEWR